ncbi:MAG: AAA family ATPase [Planctomycetota bacterium]|nr:AAA family ATPase [Planctomycetota bacterium]
MIKSLTFRNFKALRDTVLPLGPFTLIVGPNGSGKSSVFQGLKALQDPRALDPAQVLSTGVSQQDGMQIVADWDSLRFPSQAALRWPLRSGSTNGSVTTIGADATSMMRVLSGFRSYSFSAEQVAAPSQLIPTAEIGPSGEKLAVVLDRLRDNHPERFEALNEELGRWLPEFDRVLFDTPSPGTRAIQLRTRSGGHAIPAAQLSQGTLVALAILTLAHLPDPPALVGLEEPDHGMHPRLLRDVQDAIYRLAYPKDHGEDRPPVQVIATTHSPYFLDLFREHREEIVIAHKLEDNVRFERLSDYPNIEEILQDSHLGDVWYTGVLGGVPGER